MLAGIVYAFILAVTYVLLYNFYFKRRKLPPGPTPLPLIGNSWSIFKSNSGGEDAYIKWRKEYGDVFTYWQGETPMVAVAEYKKIIETFQKDGDAYAGRFNFDYIDSFLRGHPLGGVAFTEGEVWRDLRRFTMRTFRDFGVGKNVMEQKILDDAYAVIGRINKGIEDGLVEQDMPKYIDVAVASVINNLIFGYRFYGDREEEFYTLRSRMDTFVSHMTHPLFFIATSLPPALTRLPPVRGHLEKMKRDFGHLDEYFQQQIDEHKKRIDLDADAPSTDFVEAFLKEKAKRDQDGEPHDFTITQLVEACGDLFGAGQGTTSSTLSWAVAFLIRYADKQAKLHEELDRVIGSSSPITMSHKSDLAYTNAVIQEAQRLANILPQNLLHKTTKDVVIEGYTVAKGTCIVPQISVVLYDETVFPRPKEFVPERFMNDDGTFKPMSEMIAFSVGKRQCLGEGLARMELFIFLANVFNHFKFSTGKHPPSLKRNPGFGVIPERFTCRVEKRYQ